MWLISQRTSFARGNVGAGSASGDSSIRGTVEHATLTAAEQAAAPNLLEAFEEKRQYLAWHLDYYGYVPGKNEYAVESLLTVGNGF